MSALRSMETTHKSTTVLRCRVAVVGDGTVGKSALLQVLKSGGHDYPKNYVMTTEVAVQVKSIPLPDTNVVVELFLFDCPGQSVFNQREFGALNYQNASIAVVVFDVNNRESFKSCAKWFENVVGASSNHKIPGVLLANKIDLRENNREAITTQDAQEFAQRANLKYFECSALQTTGVDAPFTYIAEWFYKKYQNAAQRA